LGEADTSRSNEVSERATRGLWLHSLEEQQKKESEKGGGEAGCYQAGGEARTNETKNPKKNIQGNLGWDRRKKGGPQKEKKKKK